MTRQRSLSTPELFSSPLGGGSNGSGGRVPRPVPRRLQSLRRPSPQQQQQQQQQQVDEALPASALEGWAGAAIPAATNLGRSSDTGPGGGFGGLEDSGRMASPMPWGGAADAQHQAATPQPQQGSLSELLASAAAASRSQRASRQVSQAAAVQAALEALAAGQQPANGAAALAAARQLAAAFGGGGEDDFAAAAAALSAEAPVAAPAATGGAVPKAASPLRPQPYRCNPPPREPDCTRPRELACPSWWCHAVLLPGWRRTCRQAGDPQLTYC